MRKRSSVVLWTYLKNQAIKRDIPWAITVDELDDLKLKPCYYCGAPASNSLKTDRHKNASYRIIRYQGLDRIDSKGIYELNNVLPCCGICNRMKSDMHIEKFLEQCERIVDKHQSKA